MKYCVANWKSYVSITQAREWFAQTQNEMSFKTENVRVIVCPDFITVGAVSFELTGLPVELGAQDCSAFASGAHTGEITAEQLRTAGVSSCIIGHSETRTAFCQTPDMVCEKVYRAAAAGVRPILCVSDAFEAELEPLDGSRISTPFFIAYEPIGSIGTGKVPPAGRIESVLARIGQLLLQKKVAHCSFLYGGSVDAAVAAELIKIPKLDGFLVGRASTDFQAFKNIVLSSSMS